MPGRILGNGYKISGADNPPAGVERGCPLITLSRAGIGMACEGNGLKHSYFFGILAVAVSVPMAWADPGNMSASGTKAPATTTYRLHDLGSPDFKSSYARSLSSNGKAAGYVTFDIAGSQRPALFQLGQLPTPIYTDGPGEATGINDEGEIVGWYWRGEKKQAFVWKNHGLQLLMSPIGGDSMATGINNRSEIVGWFEVAPGVTHGFYFHKGRMIDLGSWGGRSSQATGISKRGDIIGFREKEIGGLVVKQGVQLPGRGRAELLRPPAGFDNLVPLGVNDKGDITGSMWSSDRPYGFETAAFATRDGVVVNLQRPNCCFGTVGVAINNKGVVVGYNFDRNGDPHENLTRWDPKQGQIGMSGLAQPLGWHQLSEGNDINNDGVIVGAGWPQWGNPSRQTAIMLVPEGKR